MSLLWNNTPHLQALSWVKWLRRPNTNHLHHGIWCYQEDLNRPELRDSLGKQPTTTTKPSHLCSSLPFYISFEYLFIQSFESKMIFKWLQVKWQKPVISHLPSRWRDHQLSSSNFLPMGDWRSSAFHRLSVSYIAKRLGFC